MAAETWVVDGYNLNQFAHEIETWDGLDDTPELKGDDTDVPQSNGVLPGINYFGAAHKAVTMKVNTADPTTGVEPTSVDAKRQNFDKNLDSLLRVFYRRKLLTVVRTLSDGTQRTAQCKTASAIQPTTLGIAGARLTFDLMLPYAFWRDVNAISQTSATGLTPGSTADFPNYNLATAPMSDLVYTINGPVTNPKVTCQETGAWFKYTGVITTGQWLNVDAGLMIIAGGGGLAANIANMSHGGDPRWLTLVPNIVGCKLTLDGSGMGGATSITIGGKRAYLR